MIHRRQFFAKCAAFVAGCAMGVGIERKKLKLEYFHVTVIAIDPDAVNRVMPIFFKRRQEGFAKAYANDRAFMLDKPANQVEE